MSAAEIESSAETIRIVAGHPTDRELAALVVALATIAAEPPGPESWTNANANANANGWSAPWRGLRTTLRPGTDAWRFWGRS